MSMKDLKPKLQKIYHWLKERPCTHIAAIFCFIYIVIAILLCCLTFEIINQYPLNKQNNLGGIGSIMILCLYFLIGYIIITLITILSFVVECFVKFRWKIKRKFLLENKIYNFFWFLGIIFYFVISCIVVFQYI